MTIQQITALSTYLGNGLTEDEKKVLASIIRRIAYLDVNGCCSWNVEHPAGMSKEVFIDNIVSLAKKGKIETHYTNEGWIAILNSNGNVLKNLHSAEWAEIIKGLQPIRFEKFTQEDEELYRKLFDLDCSDTI